MQRVTDNQNSPEPLLVNNAFRFSEILASGFGDCLTINVLNRDPTCYGVLFRRLRLGNLVTLTQPSSKNDRLDIAGVVKTYRMLDAFLKHRRRI